MLLLDRTPVLAGMLLGLLVYKPQFGLLVPLALAVSGRWRVFWTAATTVIAVCAATYFAYGAAVWDAFFESLAFTRTVVLEEGGTGFYKIQSAFRRRAAVGRPGDAGLCGAGDRRAGGGLLPRAHLAKRIGARLQGGGADRGRDSRRRPTRSITTSWSWVRRSPFSPLTD